METEEKQTYKLTFRSRSPDEDKKLDGLSVVEVLKPVLLVRKDGKEEIELPNVRLVSEGESKAGSSEFYGPDRARVWKMAGEWVQELVIDKNPVIQEKRHKNRVKAESSYLYHREDPDLYEWQEDEEILETIRPHYSDVKDALLDRIGKPARSDFSKLYPHKYDDPGLSEQARRTVWDLKAVFGSDILNKV